MSYVIIIGKKQAEKIRKEYGELPPYILVTNKVKEGGVMKGKKPTKKPTKKGK